MNRRTFLRSIATVCGAAVVCPGELVKPDPWAKAAALRKKNAAAGERIYAINYPSSGVTDAQLRELVQMTLKDLPQDCTRISFSGIDYTLCRNSKGEYYSGGYEFNR